MDHCGGVPNILQLLQRRWAERHPEPEHQGTDAQPSAQPLSPLSPSWTATGTDLGRVLPLRFPAPRIHKFPFSHPQSDAVLHNLPRGAHVPTESGSSVHPLREGQIFPVTSGPTSSEGDEVAEGQTLQVLETPGHTPDSICLYLAADAALFTGDTVLGNSSTVFEDLGTYMASLRKMIAFNKSQLGPGPGFHIPAEPEEDGAGGVADPEDGADAYAASIAEQSSQLKYKTLYPGHGPAVPSEHVAQYLKHRTDRENQILDVLTREPPALSARNGYWTTWAIVRAIYRGLPGNMAEAAAHSTTLHLQKLEGDNRVECVSGEGFNCEWRFLEQSSDAG